MTSLTEQAFVEAYVRKDRRERLLHELSNPRKRSRALDRFCHGAADLLDPAHITLAGPGLEHDAAFNAFVAAHAAETCRVFSPDGGIDGLELPLAEAVAACVACLDASIIMSDGFAIVRAEAWKGGTDMWLLEQGRQA